MGGGEQGSGRESGTEGRRAWWRHRRRRQGGERGRERSRPRERVREGEAGAMITVSERVRVRALEFSYETST